MKTSDPRAPRMKRILFCTDFSRNADLAFPFAVHAAQSNPGAVLYLLHVIPEPEAQFWKTYIYEVEDVDAKARQDIDAKVAESYLCRVPPGVELRVEMRIGNDAQRILELAREHDIDLIVIGRQGHGGWGNVLFGNVSEKVTRKAHCPVLVVPMGGQARMAGGPQHDGEGDGTDPRACRRAPP